MITPASQAARDLASKADIALYAAKAAGRNTFKVFDEAMQKEAEFRNRVVDDMEAARLPVQRGKVA